ncbi:hypothetical protein D3C77_362920 [compost metagenome]
MSRWVRKGSSNILSITVKIVHICISRPLYSQIADVLNSGKLPIHLLVRGRNRDDGLNVVTFQAAQRLVRAEPVSRVLRHSHRLSTPGMSD